MIFSFLSLSVEIGRYFHSFTWTIGKKREKSLDDIDGAPQLVLPPHSAAGLFVYLLYIMYRETVHFPPVDSLKLISFPCNNALTHT